MTEPEQTFFTTGSVIDGKWILIELIGEGGMGEVSRAHQLNLKSDVAIKVISAELLQNFEEAPEEMVVAIGRFQREVQTMASVRHPNNIAYSAQKGLLTGYENLAFHSTVRVV